MSNTNSSDNSFIENEAHLPKPTMEDYQRVLDASVRIVERMPTEEVERIEADFRRAYERAEAILAGRLDPLSG